MIYLDDDIAGFDLEAALPLLSAQRREQMARFRHELGRKTCALAYVLLRRGLLREYGVAEAPWFDYDAGGKPHLAGRPDIHFSLSHCSAGVVCALAARPVGVDIECIGDYDESLARYTMNERELRLIRGSRNRGLAFARLWTMKEAVLKWRGEGIGCDIKRALEGVEGIETCENVEKGYVFSVYAGDSLKLL